MNDHLDAIQDGREYAHIARAYALKAARIAYTNHWPELHAKAMLMMDTADDLSTGFTVKEDIEGERKRAEMPSQQIPSPWRPRVIRGGG